MVRIVPIRSIVIMLGLALGAAACSSDEGGSPSPLPNPPAPEPAEIVSFSASPETIHEAAEVLLQWEVENAERIHLLANDEPVDLDEEALDLGSLALTIEDSTTFELIATGEVGEPARASAAVELVILIDPPTIATFEGPEVVGLDEEGNAAALLSWTGVIGADSLHLEASTEAERIPLDLAQTPDGSFEVDLQETTTYALVAINVEGEARLEHEVRVVDLPMIDDLRVNRDHIGTGESVELSWETTGATRVELWVDGSQDEGLDPELLNGSYTLPLLFPSTLELRAFNEVDGMQAASREVLVAAPELLTTSQPPSNLWLGEELVINWTSVGASSFTFHVDGELLCSSVDYEVAAASSCTWTPEAYGSFELLLRVENATGSDSESWIVEVGGGPRILTFRAEPEEITAGDAIELSWLVTPDIDGEQPVLTLEDDRGGSFTVPEEGSLTITPAAGSGIYTYTLVATTSHPLSGSANASAAVEVFPLPEVSLAASPTHFDDSEDDEVILSWTSSHAASLALTKIVDGDESELVEIAAGDFAAGSHAFVPTEDATYRLVARNAIGYEVETQVAVTLAPLDILSFDGAPLEIIAGQAVELSWRTRMAQEVTLDILDGPYLVEDTSAPYLDAAALGGEHRPLTSECGFSSPHSHGCVVFAFPAGFSFPFDGIAHNTVRLFGNGILSFDYPLNQLQRANQPFPSGSTGANVHLAAYWGLLDFDGDRYPTGNIFTLLREDEDAGDSLIIQWKDLRFAGYNTGSLNFEIILWADGSFEYRYGAMRPGTAPPNHVRGFQFTTGYQNFDQSHFHTINHNEVVQLRGPFEGRSFRYSPPRTLTQDDSQTWHPLATGEEMKATLTARRGENVVTEEITVTVHPQPELLLTEVPEEAAEVGGSLMVRWIGGQATMIEVVDAQDQVRCSITSQAEIAQGSCLVSEESEAIHAYTVRATGAMGATVERSFTATFYEPFGIESFSTDRDFIEPGEEVTLSWETFNAPQLSLIANEKEYLPSGAPSGPGSLAISDLDRGSTFVLRVTNAVGVSVEETLFVDVWKVRIDLTPSTEVARPGVPFTLTVSSEAIEDEDPAPALRGTLVLEEKTGPEWSFQNIADTEGAQLVTPTTVSATGSAPISFPEGFSFPYFESSFTEGRIFNSGYLSLDGTNAPSQNNYELPDARNVSVRNVQIAPFWDALRQWNNSSLWTKAVDADTFVIQWTSYNLNVSGIDNTNLTDLNFQIWLHRDGAFEYRFGEMKPLETDLPANRCYPHNNCLAETQGASATIGYQDTQQRTGSTLHFGGTGASAANVPYPGGLANRTFAYVPVVGSKTFTFTPTQSGDYIYCTESGVDTVCKTLHVPAEFSLDSFAAEEPRIDFEEATKLVWSSRGAVELTIRDPGDQVIFTTTDVSVIDAGSFEVSPRVNSTYTIEIRAATGDTATASTDIEVKRMTLTLSAPAEVTPGGTIALSWTLSKTDPGMNPVVIAPMGEVTNAPFSQWDLFQDPDADVLLGPDLNTGMAVLEFDEDFEFPFLGVPQSEVRVSLYGYLSFDPTATSAFASNAMLPATSNNARQIHIAPFWDNLRPYSTGSVFAKRVSPDVYVIQWSRMSALTGSSAANPYDLNFQVVLHRDGSFELRYGNMQEPLGSSTACRPESCWSEANGSSATIGYQHPELLLGSVIHHSTATALNNAVPGGLSNRSWRFDPSPTGGTIDVPAWDSGSFQICAVDPVTHDTVCTDPAEVSVPWGLSSFEASPKIVRKDAPVTLSWEVENLDELRILANGTQVHQLLGTAIPASGTFVHAPSENTTYTLFGRSLTRELAMVDSIEIQTFELVLQGPATSGFPGDTVTLNWSSTLFDPEPFHVLPPLVEIPAGAGEPGAYQDISDHPLAVELATTNTNTGYGDSELPFTFTFFGESYTKIRTYVKGYISLDTVASGNASSSNRRLPDSLAAAAFVHLSPFWDNLIRNGAATIYTLSPDADTFIVQWTRFNRTPGSSANNPSTHYDLNFQVVLRSDGSFEFRYGTMAPPETPANQTSCWPASCALEAEGSSATVAYQVPGLQIAYNHHFGGDEAYTVNPVDGGLSHRTFRYTPSTSGSVQVRVGATKEYEICGFTGTFSACESVWVQAVAEVGDLMITEVMVDPDTGLANQWFEVRNLTSDPIDLEGFTIRSSRGSHAIASSVVVPPRGFRTLAASAAALTSPDYVYGTLLELDPKEDTLTLLAGTEAISTASWEESWGVARGQSLGLDPSYQIRGVGAVADSNAWCREAGGGSPGALSPGCRSPFYTVDPSSDLPFLDISTTGTRMAEFDVNNAIAEVPVTGFSMPFFQTTATKVWASGNGWISFSEEAPLGGTAAPAVSQVPRTASASPAGPLIAAFFTDLRCTPTSHDCGFFYQQTEVDERKVLILQWSGFRPANGAGNLEVQAQLWEDGDVVVAFAEARSDVTSTGAAGYRNYLGWEAWIALEGPDPQDHLTAFHRSWLDMNYRSFHFRRR